MHVRLVERPDKYNYDDVHAPCFHLHAALTDFLAYVYDSEATASNTENHAAPCRHPPLTSHEISDAFLPSFTLGSSKSIVFHENQRCLEETPLSTCSSSSLNLYHYGSRFYSPEQRRWISRDPSLIMGKIELYTFSRCQPTGVIDVLGLSEKKIVAGLALLERVVGPGALRRHRPKWNSLCQSKYGMQYEAWDWVYALTSTAIDETTSTYREQPHLAMLIYRTPSHDELETVLIHSRTSVFSAHVKFTGYYEWSCICPFLNEEFEDYTTAQMSQEHNGSTAWHVPADETTFKVAEAEINAEIPRRQQDARDKWGANIEFLIGPIGINPVPTSSYWAIPLRDERGN